MTAIATQQYMNRQKMRQKHGTGGLKMTIDEAIKNLEYDTNQLEMEIEFGLWIKGSESELCCKEGIALNKQYIEWLTKLKEAKSIIRVCNRVLGYLLECEIGSTSTRHEVETLLRNITEYLSGCSENETDINIR
jgi:hypothetical protein